MSMQSSEISAAQEDAVVLDAPDVLRLMVDRLCDGLDHPEIWVDLPIFLGHFPDLLEMMQASGASTFPGQLALATLTGVAMACRDPQAGYDALQPLAAAHSQSALVQGAVFHVQGLLDPHNPQYDLTDRFCTTPFEQIDVLDSSTHLCCASWLHTSAGDLSRQGWQEVWNSPQAQDIRASVQDGSYRHCNKTACPSLASGTLPTRSEVAARGGFWADVVNQQQVALERGPKRVNLSYDRTCNLHCPSCRATPFAADAATRERYRQMQDFAVLPMLTDAELAIITGSGDPFASKNFRQLLKQLTPEAYPDLRFQVMTNAMLLTEREWANFPTLHGRTAFLRISIDAATGPTHELLRRGARWEVMEQNLAFASRLRATGQVDKLNLSYVVQQDNYREMGDCVDLARSLGADTVEFLRLTNWGTFSSREYEQQAVFLPHHAEHAEFLAVMADPRLLDPIVLLHDLANFSDQSEEAARV
jgi:hypothetical protein